MSNAKPDFSRDPERVALAKVLREAVRSTFRSVSVPNWETMDPEWKREYLAMADAAITHLGSGYRLPEATHGNAGRLAMAMVRARGDGWSNRTDDERDEHIEDALEMLRALPTAFADTADYLYPQEPPVEAKGEVVQ